MKDGSVSPMILSKFDALESAERQRSECFLGDNSPQELWNTFKNKPGKSSFMKQTELKTDEFEFDTITKIDVGARLVVELKGCKITPSNEKESSYEKN